MYCFPIFFRLLQPNHFRTYPIALVKQHHVWNRHDTKVNSKFSIELELIIQTYFCYNQRLLKHFRKDFKGWNQQLTRSAPCCVEVKQYKFFGLLYDGFVIVLVNFNNHLSLFKR